MTWQHLAAALAAYLIGALPFGYLIYYARTGDDVRKHGSGNIGATNVGRLLGFRYFLIVFILDVLKGLIPTMGLAWVFTRLGWAPPADLPVAAALGAILGHNFPVYLGFRGGKGVATSLGALAALQPIPCLAAAGVFFLVFLLSRYVSLSSITGGIAFAAVYFWRTADSWSPDSRAMSLLVVAVVVLLIARHRKNISRLLAGTENRIEISRRKKSSASEPPAGFVRTPVLAGVAVVSLLVLIVGGRIVRTATAPVEAFAGPWHLIETHREQTGQQRASRVAFDAEGERLAVLCPRYNRILTYRIADDAKLTSPVSIDVEGRPVAIAVIGDEVAVLQRPVNDAKHLGPGWVELFTLDGRKAGSRTDAGYYPDDLAATPDGRHLLVVSSGRSEGDPDKPAPSLSVFELDALRGDAPPPPLGRLEFEEGQDPDRLLVSRLGFRLLVKLAHTEDAVAIELDEPSNPRKVGRMSLTAVENPYVSHSDDGDWIVVPSREDRAAVAITTTPTSVVTSAKASYLIVDDPKEATLNVIQVASPSLLGRFAVRGPLNLGSAETTDLAYSEARRLLAATTKSGAVHLVRLESRLETAMKPAGDDESPVR